LWATDECSTAGTKRALPPFTQNLNCVCVCVCVRSSLNTNKAPLTYCQLSEVNLSRINFRRKRFRPSRPENPLVSNYLRIDRTARQWSDECCLYLHLPLSSPTHPFIISFSLSLSPTHCTYYLYISSPLDLLLHSPYSIFPIPTMCTHVRAPTPTSFPPTTYTVSRRLPHTSGTFWSIYIYLHVHFRGMNR